jgi:hypothetical protein
MTLTRLLHRIWVCSSKLDKYRIRGTKAKKGFITKGFVLDNETLKHGKQFRKEYFDVIR